jgi:hypothetical protein
MKRLVDLATCHTTQTTTDEHGKSEWIVYNEERKIIYRLPKEWTEKQVMTAIHMGREFELIALNAGVEFQKINTPAQMRALQVMVKNFEDDRKIMVERNLMLSAELEKLNKQLDKLTIKI